MTKWISGLCVVVALLCQTGESRGPLPKRAHTLISPRLGLFESKDPFVHMPEYKYPRSELLGKITTLHTENQELRTQLTEYADKKSKSNSYLRSIEAFLVKAHRARKNCIFPGWLVALFRLLFNRDKATHYELLLEEIRQSSCAILQLEGQVSMLENDGLVMKDLLASRKASIDNLQLKLNVSKKENDQLKKALQNRRETQQNNQVIAKLQDQVEKARKESVRLTSQRDSLAEAKDKERLSYQLKIERKKGRIERLEAELDTKQKRLIDLEADVVWANSQHCDVTKDPQYDKVKRENCQMKDEILWLMATLDSLEKDNDVKRTLAEQTLYEERYKHLAKVNSLENVCLQLEKANRELQTKISQLMDDNASTRSMTNQDKAQFQAEISRKLKQEVEEESKLECNKLLANTTKMESQLSQMQHANENLKSELSALRNMQRQAKGPSMEATLQELQKWKGRTENLNLKIAECKTAASEASNERETLRRQLDVANERNRVLEAASLPQQDGHNVTVLESIDSTKSNNIQQHLEAMTKKMKESNECTKARLKEVANTSSDSGAVPFVSRGFSRPAFGLGKRSED